MSLTHSPLTAVRALSFDLDDTLWDNGAVIALAEQAMLDWLQQHYPKMADRYGLAELKALYPEALAADPRHAYDLGALRRWSLAEALRRSACDPAGAQGAFEAFQAARHRVPFSAELTALLARLAARWPLVATTNGTIDLARLGLAEYFVGQINPPLAGAAKPHAAPFLAACRLLACPPGAVLHVGDDWHLDVCGALNAGLQAAWFNPKALPRPASPSPQLELRHLSALETLIGS